MASVNKVILGFMYRDERRSIPEIAGMIGASYGVTRRLLLNEGIEIRSRADGVRAAGHKIGARLRGKRREFSEQWKQNMSKSKREYWKGKAVGVSLKPNGYVEVTRGPNKGRGLHRVVAENMLGRSLLPGEVVHHKDECRSNNSESNLEVMTRAAHTSHHRKGASNGKR